jgi:hypothetical protein
MEALNGGSYLSNQLAPSSLCHIFATGGMLGDYPQTLVIHA